MNDTQELIRLLQNLENEYADLKSKTEIVKNSIDAVKKELAEREDKKQPSLYFGDYCGERRV